MAQSKRQILSDAVARHAIEFQNGPGKAQGSFELSLDRMILSDRMKFSLAASGWVDLRVPLFHPPLGALASYAAMVFSDETELVIRNALRQAIPRIRPYGLERSTGRITHFHTPVSERILDADAFEVAMGALQNSEFRVELLINKPG